MLKKILAVITVIFLLSVLALPVFAIYPPQQLSFTGWRFDAYLDDFPWTGSLKAFLGEEFLTSLGIQSAGVSDYIFTDIIWESELGLLYYTLENGTDILAYSQANGWRQDNLRTVGFSGAFPDPANANDPAFEFATWLYRYAVQDFADGVDVPVVNWVIDNEIFSFSNFEPYADRQMTPPVTVSISDAGLVRLYVSGRTMTWRPVVGRVFTGLSFEPDNRPEINIATTMTLESDDITSVTYPLYPCYEDEAPDTFTTTIRIYNSDGSRLLFEYAESGTNSSPLLTIKPREGSIYVDGPFERLAEYSVSNDYPNLNFVGLAVRRVASVPSYGLDADISVGGTSQSIIRSFYLVFDTPINDPVGADWTSWIATAVGGFFAFELWPGLNLGDLVLTVLALGVLFSFLKLTI